MLGRARCIVRAAGGRISGRRLSHQRAHHHSPHRMHLPAAATPPARSRRRRVRQRPPSQTAAAAAAAALLLALGAAGVAAARLSPPAAAGRTAFGPPPPPPSPSQHMQHDPARPPGPLRTLLIDNYDSYTYNLAHYLAEANGGVPPLVLYNDECGGHWGRLLARHGPFDNVVISPGPGSPERPEDFGLSRFALEEPDTPVLGICLGHQGLGLVHGGKVTRAPQPMHGRLSRITHTGQGVFAGIPQEFAAVRYHSLIVEPPRNGEWELEATAWTSDGLLMGLQHKRRPHFGVQFHPESIGTHHGHALLRNFRDVTLAHTRMRAQQQQRQQQQQQGEEKTSTSVYIERPAAAAARAAAAVDTTIERREGKGARTQVLISRLGSLPGAKGSSSGSSGSGSGKLSERVFRALYGEERTAFWLDSSATATLSASSTTSPAGAVPPKHGGRYSYMGDAAAASGVGGGGKRLGHVLEYYLHTQPSSSSSPSLLRILNGDGAVEERNGAALFPHLQTTLRGMREQGVRMSVAVKDRAWREVAKEELPGLEFWGGYVGYLGYELKEECLRLQRAGGTTTTSPPPSSSATALDKEAALPAAPDAVLVFADRVVAFDHVMGTVDLIAVVEAGGEGEAAGRAWLQETEARIRSLAMQEEEEEERRKEGEGGRLRFVPRVSPEEYMERVDRCLELIAAGETYEVCLTGQLAAPLPTPTDPYHLYRRLRCRNPAPFSAFFRHDPAHRLVYSNTKHRNHQAPNPAIAICCSSPERFLRVSRQGGVVESKPIKGTVRRGKTTEEDAALAAGLAACEKNRAENLMIVDLVRNDVARVCRPGSVTVPKLMAVETYATVHQLVSTVVGELKEGKDAIDAVVASFPGGSMTGAPKKRTIEIIERLEAEGRGPYSGALGYVSLDGLSADWNIVIRTAVVTPGAVTVGAGGAIVALSEREKEYDEMVLKAAAVADAFGSSLAGAPPEEEEGEEEEAEAAPVVVVSNGASKEAVGSSVAAG